MRSWGVLVNVPIERILERRRNILFGHKGQRDMLVVGTESSEGCHDDPMRQFDRTKPKRLEKDTGRH